VATKLLANSGSASGWIRFVGGRYLLGPRSATHALRLGAHAFSKVQSRRANLHSCGSFSIQQRQTRNSVCVCVVLGPHVAIHSNHQPGIGTFYGSGRDAANTKDLSRDRFGRVELSAGIA
jgi:hypothetical protein